MKKRIREHFLVAVLIFPIWFVNHPVLTLYPWFVSDSICSRIATSPERNTLECSMNGQRFFRYEEVR